MMHIKSMYYLIIHDVPFITKISDTTSPHVAAYPHAFCEPELTLSRFEV